jgi:putative SOS response-associated peptidase YedK
LVDNKLLQTIYGKAGKIPANGEWLHTCTVITGEPKEFVREIHTRMPVILPDEHHEAWLSGEAGKEILS